MGILDNSDVAGAGVGLLGTIYNLFTNKRDFDYQKALQQKIFQREDTAVQRRMEDLQAAGINPNLAAGSSAGAGSVVSRSNTNDVNMGAALDTVQALQQIRMQKQQVENQKIENQILNNQKQQSDMNITLDKIATFNQLGLPFGIRTTVRNGNLDFDFVTNYENKINGQDTNISKIFEYNLNNLKNSADLLQKDVNWYTADKVSGMALGLLGAGSGYSNWYKVLNQKK